MYEVPLLQRWLAHPCFVRIARVTDGGWFEIQNNRIDFLGRNLDVRSPTSRRDLTSAGARHVDRVPNEADALAPTRSGCADWLPYVDGPRPPPPRIGIPGA